MNVYEHEGRRYAVIRGELYVRVQAAEFEEDAPVEEAPSAAPVVATEAPAKTSKGRSAGKRRGRPPKIRPVDDLVEQLPIPRPLHDYQCVKGHRFQSNLKQQAAKCPNCWSKVFLAKTRRCAFMAGVVRSYPALRRPQGDSVLGSP